MWYETGTTDKWKFTVYERDGESVNDYAIARSYINRFGRFASPDRNAGSVADPQSVNRYPYVRNDPVDLVDPLGLLCTLIYIDWWTVHYVNGVAVAAWYSGFSQLVGIQCSWGGWGRPNKEDIKEARKRLQEIAKAIKSAFCEGIPEGRTEGLTGSLGAVLSVAGSAEVLFNYNTGQVTGHLTGGLQVGWNGAAAGAVTSSFLYGLGESNANYSGGFTGGNFSVTSVGVYAARSSEGPTGNPTKIRRDGVTVVGGTAGVNLLEAVVPVTGNASTTHTSQPLPLGDIQSLGNFLDQLLFSLRQLCK